MPIRLLVSESEVLHLPVTPQHLYYKYKLQDLLQHSRGVQGYFCIPRRLKCRSHLLHCSACNSLSNTSISSCGLRLRDCRRSNVEVEREWRRDRGRVLTPSASPLPSRSLSARVTLGPINLRRSVKQRRLDLIHQKSTWKTLEGPLARGNGNHIPIP